MFRFSHPRMTCLNIVILHLQLLKAENQNLFPWLCGVFYCDVMSNKPFSMYRKLPFSPFLGEKCKICESRSKPPYNGLWCFTLDTKHLEFSRRCLFQVNCKAAAAITYINLEFTKLGNLWFERRGELFARNCIAIGFLRINNPSSFEVDEPDYTRVRRLK